MLKLGIKFDKSSVTKDFSAGVTVAVVALPLALGFGVTSGLTAAAGLTTAIVAGFVAAAFGGSRFQVSGPTGAMAVVLIPIVRQFGVTAVPVLGVIAGLMLLGMWALRLGKIINRVPWTVVEGFTLGIAVVIALQQLPMALGVHKAEGGSTVEVAFNTLTSAIRAGLKVNSLLVVAVALALKFSYPHFAQRLKIKVHIPASFISIIFVTILVEVSGFQMATIGEIPRDLFKASHLDWSNVERLLLPALMIAILAAVESLLSARVADSMAHSVVHFDPNREIFGQGLATLASSLLGGMPATGAIARTSVNVRSHAQSTLASIFHALALLVIALLAAPLVSKIPAAAIAGVLIGTSYRILNPRAIRESLRTTKSEVAVLLSTAVCVVGMDLIRGMAIGLILHFVLHYSKNIGVKV